METLAIPLKEFDAEMATTRRLLARVPMEQAAWKPHPKSMELGYLARLVSMIPGWIADTLRKPDIDLGGGEAPEASGPETAETLVAAFDRNVQAARDALADVTGAALDEPWSLRNGERVLMTLPRGSAVRQHLGHLSHHRGQLTVYARLLDVPVPSIYGPTADESW
ncbi:MAG TPA: DinB family protein [Rhodothermales bacterium]|nr:DinB family protein [Rhodothermales bacterium]